MSVGKRGEWVDKEDVEPTSRPSRRRSVGEELYGIRSLEGEAV